MKNPQSEQTIILPHGSRRKKIRWQRSQRLLRRWQSLRGRDAVATEMVEIMRSGEREIVQGIEKVQCRRWYRCLPRGEKERGARESAVERESTKETKGEESKKIVNLIKIRMNNYVR